MTPRLHLRTSASITALLAMSIVAAVVAPPAEAATVRQAWVAAVGPSGQNGASELRAYTSGTGSLSLNLRHLRPYTTYAVLLARGPCEAPGPTVARLPSLVASSTGAIVRTLLLSAVQLRAVSPTGAIGPSTAVRVGTGSLARCGTLLALAVPRTPPPCPSAGTTTTAPGVAVLNCFPGPSEGLPNGFNAPDSPSTMGWSRIAVGPTRVVVATNDYLAIYTRGGDLLQATFWDQVFGSVQPRDAGDCCSSALYDPSSHRFFVVVAGGEFGRSDCATTKCWGAALVAVSSSDAPSNTTALDWHLYAFDGGTTLTPSGAVQHNSFIDDPVIAVYHHWLLISSPVMSFVGESFVYRSQLRVIALDPLLAGKAVTTWRDFTNWPDPVTGDQAYRLQPAVMLGDAPVLYLANQSSCGFNVWSLDVDASAPTPTVWPIAQASAIPRCGTPDPAPQPGAALPLDPGDTAVRAYPVYREGHLWVTKEVGLPEGGQNVAAAAWDELDLSGWPAAPVVVQAGVESIAGTWVTFPWVTVDGQGRTVLSFETAGPDTFGSLEVAMRAPGDPPGTLRPAQILKAGTVAQAGPAGPTSKALPGVQSFGWGSLALDPTDGTVWVIGQYVGNPTKWMTWIAQIGG